MAYAFLSGIGGSNGSQDVVRNLIVREMTEFEIPKGINKIGPNAFAYCMSLKKISIPEGVESISSSAFQSTAITDLVLPESCMILHSWSLANMIDVISIKTGNTTRVSVNAFAGNRKCLTYDFTCCTSVPQLDDINAFNYINSEAKILVPATLYDEWIQATNWVTYKDYIVGIFDGKFPSEGLEYCFNENSYSVRGIGSCTDEVVVIPPEYESYPVTSIEMLESKTMKELILPDSVTWIASTINGCTALERVVFGANFGAINYWAFEGNVNCKVYDFSRCLQIPTIDLYDDPEYSVFSDMPDECKIIVPAHLLDDWKIATNWTMFADHIVAAE